MKTWNPNLNPKFYLLDYSDAEIAAVNKLFPATEVYLCEFHREQAWERWAKERRHGLSELDGATLLWQGASEVLVPTDWGEPVSAFGQLLIGSGWTEVH